MSRDGRKSRPYGVGGSLFTFHFPQMPNRRFTPLVIAVSLVIGLLLGTFITTRFTRNPLSIINSSSNKLNDLLHIIDARYVDTIDIATIVEQTLPTLLSQLDPHSTYLSPQEAKEANEGLQGSFSGIGIQFTIRHDTVTITAIIPGGPAEKNGLLAGDRITHIDGQPFTGDSITNTRVMNTLRGQRGTDVSVTILRPGGRTRTATLMRDDIPLNTIDATFLLAPSLGYIHITSFGETTYPELLTALAQLQQQGFKGLVLDLRDNGGGYLGSAVQVANEFLPDHSTIVYTQGRKSPRQDYYADGRGSYQHIPLIILTNENTASAAEIVTGAMQDNDRAVVIGRRTFGKGLVQEPIQFNDQSQLHLTIARYYTPSGRCIQKPYEPGDEEAYLQDLSQRYEHGEFFSVDSIHLDTLPTYTTRGGRIVHGGGGIMPDIFVPEDTTLYTPWLTQAIASGLISEFTFNYTDQHREALLPFKEADALVSHLRRQRLAQQFIDYTDSQQLPRRNNQIRQSQPLLERALYSNVVYNMLGMEQYRRYLAEDDSVAQHAIKAFEDGATKPVSQ